MADRLLVPVDGSPLSRRALDVSCSEYPDAEITALHVIDPAEPSYSVYDVDHDPMTEPRHGSEAWYERSRELARELLDDLTTVADTYGVSLDTEIEIGRPDRVIIEYAIAENIDHIVLGSHGRAEGSRLLLGSVTEAVAFRAPMRVTLIR